MADKEFPRWVKCDESNIIRKPGDVIAIPDFPQWYRDRQGNVTVVVHNAEEEAKAMGNKVKEAVKEAVPDKLPNPFLDKAVKK